MTSETGSPLLKKDPPRRHGISSTREYYSTGVFPLETRKAAKKGTLFLYTLPERLAIPGTTAA
jgi:hypothetical protein